jgi:hypothetical protein
MTTKAQASQPRKDHTMKHLFILAAALLLAACASPRTASITDGKISNITSAEATTLVKQDNRTKRANDMMKNAPPIFKLTALPGQKIEISGVQSLEVNVPIDQALIMADQPDVTSENVQMFREVRGFARETVVPLGLGYQLLSDRKDARAASLEEARIRSAERAAENAQQADMVRQVLDRPATIITLPEGGSAGFLTPN